MFEKGATLEHTIYYTAYYIIWVDKEWFILQRVDNYDINMEQRYVLYFFSSVQIQHHILYTVLNHKCA